MGEPVEQPVEIRDARQADRAQLCELWLQLIEHHRRLDPDYPVPQPIREALLAEIDRGLRLDRCRILVASCGERLVGFAFAEVDAASRRGDHEIATGWIHELWVDFDRRSRGLGSALVERATLHLQRGGTDRVAVRVESANAQGLRFWRRRGFRERARILERS